MLKSEIRKQIKELINLNINSLQDQSRAVCDSILKSSCFIEAEEIFAYMALEDEVNLQTVILTALKEGKKLALPKIISQKDGIIQFFYLDSSKKLEEQIQNGTYNILEPDENLPATLDPTKKTLILVPGRAFTKEGDRLGRGKGYYDRFLGNGLLRYADPEPVEGRNDDNAFTRNNIVLAGVCFDFQIKKSLPVDDRDIKMDIVFSI